MDSVNAVEPPPTEQRPAAATAAGSGTQLKRSRGLEPTRLPAPNATLRDEPNALIAAVSATTVAEDPVAAAANAAAIAARKAKVVEEVRGTMFRLLARGGAVTEQDRTIMQRALDLWESVDCPMEDSTVAVLMQVYGAHSQRSWSGIFTHSMRRPSKNHFIRPIDQLTIEGKSTSDHQLSA